MKKIEFNRMRGVFPAIGLAFERMPTTDWINDSSHFDYGYWETRAVYVLRISLWWAEWELRYKGAVYAY